MTPKDTVLPDEKIQMALSIKRCVQLSAKYTPWNSNCLTQALVAAFFCRYYKLDYNLFIGVPKIRQKALGEEGHAWVKTGPVVITGGPVADQYHIISTYFYSCISAAPPLSKSVS